MVDEMVNFLVKNKIFSLSSFVIFMLIIGPSLKIPLHSDDYSYFLQGISLEAKYKHYMEWSGRVITDFISSFLLTQFSRGVYSAINSLAFLVMLIFVSLIPTALKERSEKFRPSSLALWFVFFIYWLGNPSLGQTSFWVVGSANYLWPIMWASIYIFSILYLINRKTSHRVFDFMLVWVLALFSGLSNESVSISIVLFTLILFYFFPERKNIILVALSSAVLGACALILAPGNFKRSAHPEFEQWHQSGFFDQLHIHLTQRLPASLSYIALGIFCIVGLLVLSVFIKNSLSNRERAFSITFVGLSFFSVLGYVAAPYVPPRAANTAVFFLLPVASILAFSVYAKPVIGSRIISGIALFSLLAVFLPSYGMFYKTMSYTHIQGEIREKVIDEALEKKEEIAYIPDWYFVRPFKETDNIELHRSGAMPAYYGIDRIEWVPARFNYAQLVLADKFLINKSLNDELRVNYLYKYNDGGREYIILEFNRNPSDFCAPGESFLYFHAYIEGGEGFINIDTHLGSFTRIGNLFYYSFALGDVMRDKVERINFGFYDSVLNSSSAHFSISKAELAPYK